MGLSKYRIGDLITVIDERNSFGYRNFYGININKEFMPTVANTNGLDESKYKVVRNKRFVFSGMQTGRDECIRLSMFNSDEPVIVSPAYTTFEVTAEDKILPTYFFIRFLSKEKDRYGSFLSDGSIRSNLDWSVYCDIEMELPSIDIQQKYVDVYNAMVANQQCYERGLEDLKFTCDAYIEKSKNDIGLEKLGKYITQRNVRNMDNSIKRVMGLSTKKIFREPQSRVNKNELSKYKIVRENEFAFVPTTDTWKVLAFSYNTFCEDIVVSPIYEVFSVDLNNLLPGYLAIWLSRKDFDRYARLHSWGSARENFSFEEMCDVDIPIPSIDIQQDIVNIYNAYNERKNINERLKKQIKDICPILIKGSIEEGKLDKGV